MVNPAEKAKIERELGLDRPIPVQYLSWIGGIAQGDLGYSYVSEKPAIEEIAPRIPVTAKLALMRVLVFTRTPAKVTPDLGEAAEKLEALLRDADYISLHYPLNEATRGLISRTAIAAMRPGAFLINTGRGALVDEAALAEALASEHELCASSYELYTRMPAALGASGSNLLFLADLRVGCAKHSLSRSAAKPFSPAIP